MTVATITPTLQITQPLSTATRAVTLPQASLTPTQIQFATQIPPAIPALTGAATAPAVSPTAARPVVGGFPETGCSIPQALTPTGSQGLYYLADSPWRSNLVEPDAQGTKLTLTGLVMSPDCKPISHALLDFWQADASGNYSINDYQLRGHQFTDADGRYMLETILPGISEELMPVIHVKVQAPLGPTLTTQLFFPPVATIPPGSFTSYTYRPALLLNPQVSGEGEAAQFNFVVTPGGELDPLFGTAGMRMTSFNGVNAEAKSLALLSDGRFLVAGGSFDLPIWDFALARYLPDGRLDETFGKGGKVVTSFGGDSTAFAMQLQPDGKAVLAGTVSVGPPASYHTAFALARYLPSGQLDPSFGDHGRVITDYGPWASTSSLALQPDGGILVAGSLRTSADTSQFVVLRFRQDGSLDPTFGDQGKVITTFPKSIHTGNITASNAASSVVVMADGKILAGGVGSENFALARYNPDGSPDKTFGQQGLVTTDFGGLSVLDTLLLPQGAPANSKIIAVGVAVPGKTTDIALARYNQDGSLDKTFGIQGKTITDLGYQDGISAAIMRPDGKILLAGYSFPQIKYVDGYNALLLYTPYGRLDPSFGEGGLKNTSNYGIGISTMALQPDGMLLVAGSMDLRFGLARFK